MICCDECGEWMHAACVGLLGTQDQQQFSGDNQYLCPLCDPSTRLPSFTPDQNPVFVWGSSLSSSTFTSRLNTVYSEVVHWKPNLFFVPMCNQGTMFVQELSALFKAYGESTPMESIALKAAMVFPPLLLQRPHHRSTTREHKCCLERRLQLWKEGDLLQLLREGHTIQQHLRSATTKSPSDTARTFAHLLFQGKVKAALRVLSSDCRGNFLPLDASLGDSTVLQELKKKHPPSSPVHYDSLIDPRLPDSDVCLDVIFESLDGVAIRQSCLKVDGAAGPSGADAACWRRLCTSFNTASSSLCDALASVARKIATTYVDPSGLSPLLSSRLIALDKNPSVRPIGIGETSRRIISKAILCTIKQDILEAAGNLQLCAGQEAGCEAAIHAMHSLFQSSDTQAVLLADTSNAFNSLNRRVSPHNLHFTCPPLAVTVSNVYREASSLFIVGQSLLSEEGTTQGDPLAMAMYALSTTSLIH